MRVDFLTIFPRLFEGFLTEGMVRIARDKGLLEPQVHDIREHAEGIRRAVDDKPFGGGPGMVFKPEPVFRCIEAVIEDGPRPRFLLPSPVGRPFDQEMAIELAREERLLFFCGRYEGYDERIKTAWDFEEISIGDYVVTGGELPSMVVADAVIRRVPGVLGHDLSALEDTFESPLLDHPHYTRPAEFRGLAVPSVLLSGDHARVESWRREQSELRTRERRPDLWAKHTDLETP